METIVEKDSPVLVLAVLGGIFVLFVSSIVGLAYLGGVFTGEDAVAENDKRIANQAHFNSPPPVDPAKP
jgi:hypothetical protein